MSLPPIAPFLRRRGPALCGVLLLPLWSGCAMVSGPRGAFRGPPRWDLDRRVEDSGVLTGRGSRLEILGSDLAAAPGAVLHDVGATLSRTSNWPLLGGAVLGGLALENSGLNADFRRDDFDSSFLSEGFSGFLDRTGRGSTLLAIGAGIYAWGLSTDDPRHYLAGRTALASMASTGFLTLATKLAVNDTRPNGRDYGYPSGHTSMSVALATSLHSSYGWKVSAPVFALSALVAFQRLDSGAHDLDDLLVGAALGFLVSREVHHERGLRFLGADVAPYFDPELDAYGLSLTWVR